MTAPTDQPHFVYRAYSDGGHLLYVGCTRDVDVRLIQHEGDSVWTNYCDSISTEPYANLDAALVAEAAAIRSERPVFNSYLVRSGTGPRAAIKRRDRDGSVHLLLEWGLRLANARRSAGWTQHELAARVGVSRTHISRMEGGYHSASNALRFRLADALGVSVSDLFPYDIPQDAA